MKGNHTSAVMVNKKNILLLGAGYVAGPAADYLVRRPENHITVACRRVESARELASKYPGRADAVSVDVSNEQELDALVAKHDLVISLIPWIHHTKVIQSAIKAKKNVATTSYVTPAMLELDAAAKEAGITVMNEIGLDPGIDHLYAVKMIDEVHKEGGKILAFLSYCGGLPAPEASNNPLGYKFSWSSRGVLLALRSDARYIKDGKPTDVAGPDLMDAATPINTYPAFAVVGYPNRDSSGYNKRYNIPEVRDLVRGTLRYQVWPNFAKTLVDFGFLNDADVDYLSPSGSDITWAQVLAKTLKASNADKGELERLVRQKIRGDSNEKDRIIRGFKWLGLLSDTAVHRRGNLLDTFCATLEDKMQYGEGERDMVLLQHRFEVELKDGTKQTRTSTLLEYGDPKGYSAMARTVGIPCGIATQLILDGHLNKKGILAPMSADINDPIIRELEKEGIRVIDEVF